MVGLYCAVSGCGNSLVKCRGLGLNITFHRFPADPSLREIWVESCNRGENWRKQNVFMCSAHFTPSDFWCSTSEGGHKRTHLIKGAVPSRNLPTSELVCCAVGCSDAPPEILVKRFPADPERRIELLGDVPRKQGIPLPDCYLCERHLALKKFLKDEVRKIARKKESEEADIVILEVSKVDGKHSTKLIEPPAKRRKARFHSDGLEENEINFVQPANRDETSKRIDISTHENKSPRPSLVKPESAVGSPPASVASSDIGTDPLPVLVKNGGSSQLMFLHRSPHLSAGSLPNLDTGLNTGISNTSKILGNIAPSENRSVSPETRSYVKSTGNLLIDRLYKRIQELEEKMVSQREAYKAKMSVHKDKCSENVRQLTSRVKELKNEVQSYQKIHRNGKSRLSRPGVDVPKTHGPSNPLPKISAEVYQILRRSFTNNQIKKIMNEAEIVRWTDSELLDAYTLKHLSYGAYTFVRNHLKYPLPSPKYLSRWLSRVENKEKKESNPCDDGYFPQNPCSESENESEEELDIMVAESVNSENMCGEVILEQPSDTACNLVFDQENAEDGATKEEDLDGREEILIVGDPDDCSSSNVDISNDVFLSENEFEEYCPLDTSKESLLLPGVYVLKPSNENPEDREPANDTSLCPVNIKCEQSDNDDSGDGFGHVLIVEKLEGDASHDELSTLVS